MIHQTGNNLNITYQELPEDWRLFVQYEYVEGEGNVRFTDAGAYPNILCEAMAGTLEGQRTSGSDNESR